MSNSLQENQNQYIDELVEHYIDNRKLFTYVLHMLVGMIELSDNLKKLIHSTKHRTKDPEHLKDKLMRKAISAIEEGKEFDITKENLFSKITDFAGFRIIHLHTRQIEQIDAELKKLFKEQQWIILEGPNARTWDDESRQYFQSINIDTSPNPNMYTSIHYIIQPNSHSITCEVQVRTLLEEVWGEVDHSINYPHKTESISCREQIKTLARITSGCSRLVDSIFSTHKIDSMKDAEIQKYLSELKALRQ